MDADRITLTLMAERQDGSGKPWEIRWALLDELHEDALESGLVVAAASVTGLEALRIALSAAWRAARHLHA